MFFPAPPRKYLQFWEREDSVMKKRMLTLLLALALCFSLAPCAAASEGGQTVSITYRKIRIVADNTELAPTDADGNPAEPFILNGSTYLPVRAVAAALGLNVDWDGETSTVLLTSGGERSAAGKPALTSSVKTVSITFRNIKISVDGSMITPTDANGAPAEPFILDGSTYLPVRAVANALGAKVRWDDSTSTVYFVSAGNGAADSAAKWRLTEMSRFAYGGTTGTETIYKYDAEGRLVSSTTRYAGVYMTGTVERTSVYTTDAAGRILTQTDSTGEYWEYRYNAADQKSFEKHGTSADEFTTTAWEYDVAGHNTKKTQSFSLGGQVVTAMTYNSDGLWDTFDYRQFIEGGEHVYGSCEYKYELPGESRPSMMIAHMFDDAGNHLDLEVTINYKEYGSYIYSLRTVRDGETEGESWPAGVSYDAYGNLVQELTSSGTVNYKYERID